MKKLLLGVVLALALVAVPAYGFQAATSITICKVTPQNPDSTELFSFTGCWFDTGDTLELGNGDCETYELDPGVYTITELVPAGWQMDSITVSPTQPDSVVYLSQGAVVVNLELDENIIITYSNSVVPEPATVGFLTLGSLMFIRRRKAK